MKYDHLQAKPAVDSRLRISTNNTYHRYPDNSKEKESGHEKISLGYPSQVDGDDVLRQHTSKSRAHGISESASLLRPPFTACLFVGGARSSWVADRFLSSILLEKGGWADVDGEASGISDGKIDVAHMPIHTKRLSISLR